MLSPSIRLITAQFSFSNHSIVPPAVRRAGFEDYSHQIRRTEGNNNGRCFINKVPRVNVLFVPECLYRADYHLFDAFHEHRRTDDGREYEMVRFNFARLEFLEEFCPKSREYISEAHAAYCDLALRAIWRVRAFENPAGNPNHISLNFENRIPLFEGDDLRPIRVWPKDENGQKVKSGDPGEKIILTCDRVLGVRDAQFFFLEEKV